MKKPASRPYERAHKVPPAQMTPNEQALALAYAARPKSVLVADMPFRPYHTTIWKFLHRRGFVVEEFVDESIGGSKRLRVWARWPHGDLHAEYVQSFTNPPAAGRTPGG